MKHKLWLIMLTFVTSLCLTFSLSACGLFDLIAPEGLGGEWLPPWLPKGGYSDNGLYFDLNGDRISYAEDERSYTVSKGNFDGTSLNIPATFNGAPVTSIGIYAFEDCSGLTNITIPDSVTSIGEYAFSGCSGLTSITIPDSVTSIGDDAFYGCSGLTSIKLPDSATSIGDDVFNGTAYYNNSSNWDESGVLYIGNYLIEAQETISGSYTICANTKVIADSAFFDCNGLTNITIPDSVTSIGRSAFNRCSGLESVTIGSGVTSIGNAAFNGTAYYNNSSNWDESGVLYIGNYLIDAKNTISGSYTIRANTTVIADSAFFGCSKLTSITIPDSVTSIGRSAFEGCSGLTSVTIPDSVTSIGSSAFYGCSGLTSVTIGSGVTSIGYGAFENCNGLTSVTIGSGVTSIGDRAFYGCSELTSVTIPDSVTSIGNEAFEDCIGLTSITIPDSVTSIGEEAFRNCSELENVTIGSGVTSIKVLVFYNCSKLKAVFYKGTVEDWGNISINNTYFRNFSLLNATRYYFTEDKPTAEEWASYDYWWHYDPATNKPTPWVKDQ